MASHSKDTRGLYVPARAVGHHYSVGSVRTQIVLTL